MLQRSTLNITLSSCCSAERDTPPSWHNTAAAHAALYPDVTSCIPSDGWSTKFALGPDSGVLRDQICTIQGLKANCVRRVDFDESCVVHQEISFQRGNAPRNPSRFCLRPREKGLAHLDLGFRVQGLRCQCIASRMVGEISFEIGATGFQGKRVGETEPC